MASLSGILGSAENDYEHNGLHLGNVSCFTWKYAMGFYFENDFVNYRQTECSEISEWKQIMINDRITYQWIYF